MSKAKWWQVYNNDEEKRVFVGKDGNSGLVRCQEFKWRSLELLSSESGLSKTKVEAILQKYMRSGMVIQNDKGDKFGYWEKVAPHLGLPLAKTAIEEDQQSRMNKAAKKV